MGDHSESLVEVKNIHNKKASMFRGHSEVGVEDATAHTHIHTYTEEPLIFRFFGKHCENVLPAGNIMHEDATAGKPLGKGTDKASINVSSFI